MDTYDSVDPRKFEENLNIATSIAATLVPQISQNELRRARQRPGDLSAYHLMLQARDLIFRLDQRSFDDAGSLLRQALALDPSYSPIHATLADWYSLRIGQGWSLDVDADTRLLDQVARTAIELDPMNARALTILGHNRSFLQRDYASAIQMFDRALDAAPNDSESLIWTCPTLAYIGEEREAIRRAERALALSPNDPFQFRYHHFLSVGLYAARDYEAAVHWGLLSLDENPIYTSCLRYTIAALVALGRIGDAQVLARRLLSLNADFRVAPLIARQPFRDPVRRDEFGAQLIDAGLPP